MINKKVLSEIAIYKGEVKMPKFFDINRSELKADILNSFITKKTLSQDNLNYAVLDYEIPFSKSFDMLQKYVTEYFKLEHKQSLIHYKSFGNILAPNEQSFSRRLVDESSLKNSPDYTMIYGVDIEPDSASIVIEYNNNRRVGQKEFISISNNFFIMFPSNQRYFITSNNSKENNIFLTTSFEYI
tara:strand:+ start:128 stop:682 length:555 start_codon:yes stop_codon:yes gene_type:complete